jgi:hypothetical protein
MSISIIAFKLAVFLKLLASHYICDYPLQGEFLAKAKNHRLPLPGVPWYQALFAHAFIQAAGVFWVTRSWILATGEFVLHAYIDFAKCEGKLTFNQDQALHIACKLIWAAIMVELMRP